jgi:hypothetical protein
MASKKDFDWSVGDRLQELTTMHREGRSGPFIASFFNNKYPDAIGIPISRASIAGIKHRQGLTRDVVNPDDSKRKLRVIELAKKDVERKKIERVKQETMALQHAPPPPLLPSTPSAISVVKLTGCMCKYPIGDPKKDDFTFCGEPAMAGRPYCEAHSQIAYDLKATNSAKKDKHGQDPRAYRYRLFKTGS